MTWNPADTLPRTRQRVHGRPQVSQQDADAPREYVGAPHDATQPPGMREPDAVPTVAALTWGDDEPPLAPRRLPLEQEWMMERQGFLSDWKWQRWARIAKRGITEV